MDLASARDITLVIVGADKTMNSLKQENAGYVKLTIKAGTYPKQTQDVPVIGYSTHIIAACDLPEQTVYTMVKTMAQNVESMSAVNKAIGGLTPKDMAVDIGVPMHKGALKFYKEAGALSVSQQAFRARSGEQASLRVARSIGAPGGHALTDTTTPSEPIRSTKRQPPPD